MGIYVDDIPIVSNSNDVFKKAITQLKDRFLIKNLGPLEFYLGIKVAPNRTEGTLMHLQRELVGKV
jgi:hypothetical protein